MPNPDGSYTEEELELILGALGITGAGAEDEDEPTYEPGVGGSTNLTLLDDAFYDEFSENKDIGKGVGQWLVNEFSANGYDATTATVFFRDHQDEMNRLIDNIVGGGLQVDSAWQEEQSMIPEGMNAQFGAPSAIVPGSTAWLSTPEGIVDTINKAKGVYGQYASFLDPNKTTTTGTGRSRATPTEVRNMYDIDQLAEAANNQWRSVLLEENPNTRKLAKEYVEMMVSSRGEKKIDFNQFIRGKIRNTTRHASIYRGRPESIPEEAFLGPYMQAAQQVLRPKNQAATAIGGAQFGSSSATYGQRLARSRENITSSGFVNGLRQRMDTINKTFGGT